MISRPPQHTPELNIVHGGLSDTLNHNMKCVMNTEHLRQLSLFIDIMNNTSKIRNQVNNYFN